MTRGVLKRIGIVSAVGACLGAVLSLRVPLCPTAALLGIPCPGCGLTRATLLALSGDLGGAFAQHPLFFVLSPLYTWALGALALGYIRGSTPNLRVFDTPSRRRRQTLLTWFGGALLVAMLGVWGARFLGYFGGPAEVTTLLAWSGAFSSSSSSASVTR